MDLMEGLRARRSIKTFSATPVDRNLLLELVDVARYAGG